MSDFGDFILIFGLFFFALGDEGVVLVGKGKVSFLFELFLIGDDFKFGSVLEDFDVVFSLFFFASGIKGLFFLSD